MNIVAISWETICQSARSEARARLRSFRPVAADLMAAEIQRFCEQSPPSSHDELSVRNTEAIALSSRISSIAHADSMARQHPAVAAEIFHAVRKLCNEWPP